MTFILADRVSETSTTTGTGTYALAGARSGFSAFSARMVNNDTCYYHAIDATSGGWEVGVGTWTTGNNLARTTVLRSSNSDAAVNWAAGTRNVSIGLPADKAITMNATAAQVGTLLQTGKDQAYGGLYRQVMSATPTSSNTGYSNWGNQVSATVTDAETGVYLAGAQSAGNISIRYKTVPSTPYAATFLVETAHVDGGSQRCVLGWYDGTKIQCIAHYGTTLYVVGYTSLTAGAAASSVMTSSNIEPPELSWFRLEDDGTNVSFYYVPGGSPSSKWLLYSVAKASGYLGSSGYTNLFFGINRNQAKQGLTVLSYTES